MEHTLLVYHVFFLNFICSTVYFYLFSETMNGDISRIPIQSLGAVFSLTDILPELPLPSALPLASNNDSVLGDNATAQEALRCLDSKDETLASSLAEALSKVSTDNM